MFRRLSMTAVLVVLACCHASAQTNDVQPKSKPLGKRPAAVDPSGKKKVTVFSDKRATPRNKVLEKKSIVDERPRGKAIVQHAIPLRVSKNVTEDKGPLENMFYLEHEGPYLPKRDQLYLVIAEFRGDFSYENANAAFSQAVQKTRARNACPFETRRYVTAADLKRDHYPLFGWFSARSNECGFVAIKLSRGKPSELRPQTYDTFEILDSENRSTLHERFVSVDLKWSTNGTPVSMWVLNPRSWLVEPGAKDRSAAVQFFAGSQIDQKSQN